MSRQHMPRQNSLVAHRRALQAMELRTGGFTWQAIAEQLGYADASGAYRVVDRALQRTLREPAEHARALAVRRCDRMLLAIWQRVIGGDLDAIDRALKIEARRARLLGLDLPDRVDVTVRVRMIALSLGLDPDEAEQRGARLLKARGWGTATIRWDEADGEDEAGEEE